MKLRKLCVGLFVCGLTGFAYADKDEDKDEDNDAHNDAHNEMPEPVTDRDFYSAPSGAEVALGRALFFDKIISGNRNISCATCHHPLAGTGDGLALSIGEGGKGLGLARDTGSGVDVVHERIPRHAPHVFNLGAKEFSVQFHDGRLFVDDSEESGFNSPAGDQLPLGLNSVLAAQAMFPVTSLAEMAGQTGENPVADAAIKGTLAGENGVWEILAQRLRVIPEYVAMFRDAYPEQINTADDIQFKDAANAIAAFEGTAWRADNSRFDQFLRGYSGALSGSEKKGMKLFYGEANCSSCHSGKFQTNHDFYAIAMPQIGPGKGHNSEAYNDGREDFGREATTGDAGDRFKFRVPSLRNVALTAPYGHAGAFDNLEAVVRHHLNPVESLRGYDTKQVRMPSRADLDGQDFVVMNDYWRVEEIAHRNELAPVFLKEKDFAYLMSFLHALTDNGFLDNRRNMPRSVPSGLTTAD